MLESGLFKTFFSVRIGENGSRKNLQIIIMDFGFGKTGKGYTFSLFPCPSPRVQRSLHCPPAHRKPASLGLAAGKRCAFPTRAGAKAISSMHKDSCR